MYHHPTHNKFLSMQLKADDELRNAKRVLCSHWLQEFLVFSQCSYSRQLLSTECTASSAIRRKICFFNDIFIL